MIATKDGHKKQRAAQIIRQKWRVECFQQKQGKVNTKFNKGHHKTRGRPVIMVPKKWRVAITKQGIVTTKTEVSQNKNA